MSGVVVTGLGPLWSAGATIAEWADARRGGPAGRPADGPEAAPGSRCFRLADDRLRALRASLDPSRSRRLDRLSLLACLAARAALADAGLSGGEEPSSGGVVFGTAYGDLEGTLGFIDRFLSRGPRLASPAVFPNLVLNAPAGHVSLLLGWRGPNLTVSQRELSGEQAVAVGAGLIAAGAADRLLVGGGDLYTPILERSFQRLRALRADGRIEPYAGRGPSGTVLGEGICFLLLESRERARARGARIYAELASVGVRSAPPETVQVLGFPRTADALVEAAEQALQQAGLEAAAIGLVVGGGNGLAALDRLEVEAVERLGLSQGKRRLSILRSIKPLTGEVAGGGAFKLAEAALALSLGQAGRAALVLGQATAGQAMALILQAPPGTPDLPAPAFAASGP